MKPEELPGDLREMVASLKHGSFTIECDVKDALENAEAQIRHILVNWQEFYAIAYAGLFTPEEISAAHNRFINYPDIEKTWPVWILSESDIKGVAKQSGSDIKGLDPDLIVHHFKRGFMPMVDSWYEVLNGAIEQARIEKSVNE